MVDGIPATLPLSFLIISLITYLSTRFFFLAIQSRRIDITLNYLFKIIDEETKTNSVIVFLIQLIILGSLSAFILIKMANLSSLLLIETNVLFPNFLFILFICVFIGEILGIISGLIIKYSLPKMPANEKKN